MTHDDMAEERERISRMEAITYIAALLPEVVMLAASAPHLQYLLKMAHLEARQVVEEFAAMPLGERSGLPGEASG